MMFGFLKEQEKKPVNFALIEMQKASRNYINLDKVTKFDYSASIVYNVRMNLEQDDVAGPIEEARRVMEETKFFLVTLPLGVAFGVRNVVAVDGINYFMSGMRNEARRKKEEDIIGRLDSPFVIPLELLEKGRERYEGDLNEEVQVYFNYQDVEFIAKAALYKTPAQDTIESRLIDPEDMPKLEEDLAQDLRSVLVLFDAFAAAGGRIISPQTRTALEQRLVN